MGIFSDKIIQRRGARAEPEPEPEPLEGGFFYDMEDGAQAYRVHVFTENDTLIVNDETDIEYLLVGGGGGTTGWFYSGGGGGGGRLSGNHTLAVGEYSIVVGEGGMGETNPNADPSQAYPGGDSFISGISARAIGGGEAGHSISEGGDGGSGAGGGGRESQPGGSGVVGQGNGGGTSGTGTTQAEGAGGGGGGFTEPGDDAGPGELDAGDGGDGILETFFGDGGRWVSGGGGGGSTDDGGSKGHAGMGGGRGGTFGGDDGESAYPGTGGGAGGGGFGGSGGSEKSRGGQGGSGIVAVRYPIEAAAAQYAPDAASWWRADHASLLKADDSAADYYGDPVAKWVDRLGDDDAILGIAPEVVIASRPAPYFDGSRLEPQDLDIARNVGQFTVAATVISDDISSLREIYRVSTGSDAAFSRYRLGISSGEWRVGGRRTDADPFVGVTGGAVEVNRISSVIASISFSTGQAWIYLDGNLIAYDDDFQDPGLTSDTPSLVVEIGDMADGDGNPFVGAIFEIIPSRSIWDKSQRADYFNYARRFWGSGSRFKEI